MVSSKLFYLSIAMCLMGMVSVAYLINASDTSRDLFSCNFEKMRGHYIATRRELSREGNTIFVSREGREFLVSRRFLVLPCVEQTAEQLDE